MFKQIINVQRLVAGVVKDRQREWKARAESETPAEKIFGFCFFFLKKYFGSLKCFIYLFVLESGLTWVI